jgi:hypothetical protein
VRGDIRDAEVLGKEFLVFRRRRERLALIGNPDDGEGVFRRDSARALPTFENAGTTERTIPVCDWRTLRGPGSTFRPESVVGHCDRNTHWPWVLMI